MIEQDKPKDDEPAPEPDEDTPERNTPSGGEQPTDPSQTGPGRADR